MKVAKKKVECDTEFLFYALLNNERRVLKASSGTTVLGIRLNQLCDLTLPIPPLPEQRAIVSKLEGLFSELDNGIAELKRAQEKLKIYRQSVLKKAFEGELTKEWRAKQTDLPTGEELLDQIKEERARYYAEQLEEWKAAVQEWEVLGKHGKKPTRISKPKSIDAPTKSDLNGHSELPVGWCWSRFGSVSRKIGDVDHRMPKSVMSGKPYLSTGNIKANGELDFDGAKQISEEDFKSLSLKIRPELGDIIFPRYGTIGRNVLVKDNRQFLVSYSCAIIKTVAAYVEPEYFYFYTLSPQVGQEIQRYVVDTTQANIGIASLEKFVFPLCPKAEQEKIVEEVKERLEMCERIEQDLKFALHRSERLRQSLLKRSFEGRLLTEGELERCRQEVDWCPASALLERVSEMQQVK